MAKLKAHGRELCRITKERTIPDGPDTLCTWERFEMTLHADRKILAKETVIFKSDNRRYAYPWRLKAKLKPEIEPWQWLDHRVAAGWTVVHQHGITRPAKLPDNELLAILGKEAA